MTILERVKNIIDKRCDMGNGNEPASIEKNDSYGLLHRT